MSAKVTIKVDGLDAAVKALSKRTSRYAQYLGKVLHNALVRGSYQARAKLNGGSSGKSVHVSVEKEQVYYSFAVCRLNADGEGVVFLEFGAGDYTNYGVHGQEDINFTEQTGIPIVPGSYSSTVGIGMYSGTGIDPVTGRHYPGGEWYFNGEIYRGVYPRRGMFLASTIVKNELVNPTSKSWTNAEKILK